jgi:hypothetical protein
MTLGAEDRLLSGEWTEINETPRPFGGNPVENNQYISRCK